MPKDCNGKKIKLNDDVVFRGRVTHVGEEEGDYLMVQLEHDEHTLTVHPCCVERVDKPAKKKKQTAVNKRASKKRAGK